MKPHYCGCNSLYSLLLHRIRMDMSMLFFIVQASTALKKNSLFLSRKTLGFLVIANLNHFLLGFLQPIGALNPKRAAFYAERYETWDDDGTPSHHYTTLYSTAHSTLMWMLRIVSSCFAPLQTSTFSGRLNTHQRHKASSQTDFSLLVPVGALHHLSPQR